MSETAPPPPPPPAPPQPGRSTLPWETAGVGWVEGLIETVKMFFTDPRGAFAAMPKTGELSRPLLYGVILMAGTAIVANALYTLFPGMLGFLSGDMGATFLATPIMAMFSVVVFPLVTVFILLFTAGISHLCLSLVGGASEPFAVTLRTMCYAATPSLLCLVPLCGGFVGAIWTLYLMIIGLAVTHATTTGKAALAVLLPNLLCCGVSLLFSMLAGLLAGMG